MDSAHGKKEQLAAIARLRDRFGEPGAAAAKRIPDGREPHCESADQRSIAVVRRREGHAGRDAQTLGRKALEDIAQVAKPDTLLAWDRKRIGPKFDGSKRRGFCGRRESTWQSRSWW
jgi:hypothetical protein